MTKHLIALAALAALGAAPAFAQRPAVLNRAEIPAPNEGQAGGRATAGQAGREGQVGNRPIAGQSVPQSELGQVGAAQAGGRVQAGTRPTTVQLRATGVNDALFAAAVADSGLAELTIAQLGVQRAQDPELKRFSEQMIQDHTRLNNELATLAARKGYRIPNTVDVKSQFCAESLAGLTGEKFDECYARAQLVAHMEAVAAFEAESERGVDPDMKAFAAQRLPTVKKHLAQLRPMAERCCKEEKESAGHERNEGALNTESRIGAPGGKPVR